MMSAKKQQVPIQLPPYISASRQEIERLLVEDPPRGHFYVFEALGTRRKKIEYPTYKEAGERMGVTARTISNWVKKYNIPAFRIRGTPHVYWPSLELLVLEEIYEEALESSEKLER